MREAMPALNVVWQQFVKNFDKAPGWVPLLCVNLLVLGYLHPPTQLQVWAWTIPLTVEVLAAACTLAMYVVGDALDEVIFKTKEGDKRVTRERFKRGYEAAQEPAVKALGVRSGLYSVALKLAEAAEKERATLAIHIANEAAKCVRSFVVPALVGGIVALAYGRHILGALCLVAAVIAFVVYPKLKVQHIRRLYSVAAELRKMGEHYHREPLGDMLLFFWDGSLVGSARAPK